MASYNITRTPVTVSGKPADLFKIGFGAGAQNDEIVRDAQASLDEIVNGEQGGNVALLNGPASLPVAVVLAHHLGHRWSAIGVFDPKLAAYVVATAHGPDFSVGDLIPAADVQA